MPNAGKRLPIRVGLDVLVCPSTETPYDDLVNATLRRLQLQRKKHKKGNAGTHSGFFGPMHFRKKKKLSTFMN